LEVVFVVVHAGCHVGQLFPVYGTHLKCPPLGVGVVCKKVFSSIVAKSAVSLYQLPKLTPYY
jgi:hypothetical protein